MELHRIVRRYRLPLCWLVGAVAVMVPSVASALDLTAVDSSGAPVAGVLRWLLEEDNTVLTTPYAPANNSIGVVIHKSHAPVVGTGRSASNPIAGIPIPDPSKRYFLSVLAEGYQLGAASIAAGQTTATVLMNKHPVPTAQITFVAFVDHDRINNAIDDTDPPLGGCKIIISDMAGQVMMDAFGRPLGTRYRRDANGDYILVDGSPVVEAMGDGTVRTLTQREFDAGQNPHNLKVGEAIIKNLAPGKYGTTAIPPATDDEGNPLTWVQTTTIEGTPTTDAWVAANEPAHFVEGFGTGLHHVAQGFVKLSPTGPSLAGGTLVSGLPWNQQWPQGGTATVRGQLRYNHFAKPPSNQIEAVGPTVPEGWIGLNDPNNQPGVTPGGLFAMACNEDGTFEINNLPAGEYQLVSWDTPLDSLFGVHAVMPANQATLKLAPGETVDLGNLLVFRWFGTTEGRIFYDADQDGFPDPGEPGIGQMAVNLRFRNGTVYQSTLSRPDGSYELAEVFPFFKWLVSEVDFARYKATGMTAVVDAGGLIPADSGWAMPSDGARNPQVQYETDPVTGIANLAAPIVNPNTGNALSRTETGCVLTQAHQLFLNQNDRIDWGKADYAPGENGGISGIVFYSTTRAEEDPRDAGGEPWEPGVPRVQMVLYTDVDNNNVIDDLDADGGVTIADVDNHPLGWADGAAKGPEDVDHNNNGMFDSGDALDVAWTDSWDDTVDANPTLGAIQVNPPVLYGKAIIGCDNYSTWNQVRPGVFDGGYAFTDTPAGAYIVQTCPPPGYLIQTEDSVNVGFGDSYIPSKLATAPECVGTRENHGGAGGDTYAASIVPANRTDPYTVAPVLSLFPSAAEPAPFAGEVRPLADMKRVIVVDGRNAAADFHTYTEVPKAGRVCGFVLNDLGAEFNQAGVNYGEKLPAPWIPISIRDWTGTEIQRVYSDEFGCYNALMPSTYSVQIPMPSGVAENMLTVVLNDPVRADGTPDPYYNPMYVTAPWTLNYSPGNTTYLDTPIVPQAAFTTAEVRIDTEPQDGEPVIKQANGPEAGGGPWISTTRNSNRVVTITAMGVTPVINPDFDPTAPAGQPYINRDYGFGGTPGTVTLAGMSLDILGWSATQVQVAVPMVIPTGTLLVTRGDNGLTTQIGITLHSVNTLTTGVHLVPTDFPTIQAAIDSGTVMAGDLVLVRPGLYNENVILSKPVMLQGFGHGSTLIYGNPNPPSRLQDWHAAIDALGGKDLGLTDLFQMNEAPVVLVCGELTLDTGTGTGTFNPGNRFGKPGQAQVDGFTLFGSKAGGGVFVAVGGRYTKISNNNIHGNQGGDAGAITVGTQNAGFDSGNHDVQIVRNRCHRNSGIEGAGAISMNEYSNDYLVAENTMIGNFCRDSGAAFKHLGLSSGTNVIRNNTMAFNENMYQALLNKAGDGGGMYIAGDVAGGTGAGNLVIDGNLVQGNLVGSGRGAGICLFAVNGVDVVNDPTDPSAWYKVEITNNIIVNNIAANAGGGILVDDAVNVLIAHNTIANNMSTATSRLLFNVGMASPPQGAGIVVTELSAALATALGQSFVSPVIARNIIWHNHSMYYDPALNGGFGGLADNPNGQYQDLTVIGTGTLNVSGCLLTSTAGYPGNGNITGDPQFVAPYTSVVETAAVADEGGNNLNIRYSPINVTASYHVGSNSAAVDRLATAYLASGGKQQADFDGNRRPFGPLADIGADEYAVSSGTMAQNDHYTVVQRGILAPFTGVLANDTSAGGGTFRAVKIADPAHGTLTLYSNGRFIYRPDSDFTGVDSFRYRAQNGSSYVSNEATVFIEVRPSNTRPSANTDRYTVNGGTTFTLPAPGILANDIDPDGDALSAQFVLGPIPDRGSLTVNPDGSFSFTPEPGYRGTVRFIYRASDGSLQSSSTLVLITVTPAMPDFVVTGIALDPLPVQTGTAMAAHVTVVNQGSVAGDGGRLAVWLNLPGADVAAGTAPDAFVNTGVLAVGTPTTFDLALIAPAIPAPVENLVPPIVFRAFINADNPPQPEFPGANNQMAIEYNVVPYAPEFEDLPQDTDGVDTDGDGIVDNDVVYEMLGAGDGFATMADGTELYMFGFARLTAARLAAGHFSDSLMMAGMLKGQLPGPTIVVKEGQKFYLDLFNSGMAMRPDLFDPHTVHFHGFPQAAPIYDGEPMGSISINMGAVLRYFYFIHDPGTYMYHCHVEATEHMEMGMLANLCVLPKQNNLPDGTDLNGFTHHTGYKYAYNDGDGSTYYDVDALVQETGFDRRFHEDHIAVQPLPFWSLGESYPMLNGRGYPDTVNPAPLPAPPSLAAMNPQWPSSQIVTSLVTAQVGQKILLRVSSLALSEFHTLTVLGIPMRVVGKDAKLLRGPDPDGAAGPQLGQDLTYETTSITLGGGESADLILDTTGVSPGVYFVYDSRLKHLCNDEEDFGGMMTQIVITPAP